uniref:Reverse transcriptase domain-containing protein n=1 Tax=Tanacetum cinerariifolium TaxID=118510 RepID=A0A6L2MST8_TANCI|nr:reverse transcriptase domain-containing protein [Tanacetum cinerariifolium]
MFPYGNKNADAIKLKLFPSSLFGDAKVWFNELSPGVITTWEEMRRAFVSRFFPPAMLDRLMREIRGFTQNPHESLVDAWLHEATQAMLGARGILLYKTHNEAHQLLKDRTYAIVVEDHTHRQSVMTKQWEDPRKKKLTMLMKDIQEEDIEETPKVEIPDIGEIVNQETITEIQNLSGKKYDPPVNPNDKTTVIHDDTDEEANEAKKEEVPSFSKQNKSDPLPLKAYKPKIPYPQRLRKEKMEERYAKFINLIKEIRINVPLVDVLASMPNYGKFLKDLVSNKSKMEQISAAFLNEECSTIIQNKLPPKLGVGDDRNTFLINKSMQHSHYNDDTCLRIDVIDEVTEEKLDALLDDSEPLMSMSEKINGTSLDKEFEEFMVVDVEEIPKQEEEAEDNFKELPLEEKLRIKTSI